MLRVLKTVLVASTLAAALTACATTSSPSAGPSPTTRSISQAPPAPSSATSAPSPGATRASPPAPPKTGTGIAGVTTIDGGCPVTRAEPPCPDRPIAAHLSILDTNGTVVASVDSGTDGHFTVALQPGAYLLRPETLAGAPPHAPQAVSVTVKPGQYTVITL